nr:galactosyldiacylglycerol synthase [Streptomyces sp. SID5468]
MGAGHDAVAGELARRLGERGAAPWIVDVLGLLPGRSGAALRAFYATTVRYAPPLYEGIYRAFFTPRGRPVADTSPVVVPAARALARLLARADRPPRAVVSTFHLAAQACGRLRAAGQLQVPSVVVVTDFAAHRQWVHPANDLHLCPTPRVAEQVRALGGGDARAPGPVVPPGFEEVAGGPPDAGYAGWFGRRAPGRTPVLVSSGAWGVGAGLARTVETLSRGGCLPVVLCGRNEALRRRVARIPGALPLGWVDDMPAVLSAVRVLVENAAGQTAAQALAAGVPVVGYRPIPGHGVDGARRMAADGLSSHVERPGRLLAEVTALAADGPLRRARIAAGRALFTADPAALVARAAGLADSPVATPHPPPR